MKTTNEGRAGSGAGSPGEARGEISNGTGGWRARYPHLAGDLRGAVASQLVGMPYSITSGMLAFAPLGPDYIASGIAAGLASSAVAGITAALVGGAPCQISGPRGSVAVLMGGLITAIMGHAALAAGGPPDTARVLGLAMLCIALSGALQVAFGLLRFGSIMRFLPYPVISGFMVALGLLVLLPQVPMLAGLAPGSPWQGIFGTGFRWGAAIVGIATVASIVLTRKHLPRWPAPLVGMVAGMAVHYGLIALLGPGFVGMAGVDTLVGGTAPPMPWTIPALTLDWVSVTVVASQLPLIATIAFIGSLESLLSASVLGIASQARSDGNRELVSQGVSNVAVAALGGVVSCGAPFRGVANYGAGGRTVLSGAFHSLIALPLLLFALPVLLLLPIAALAGVLTVAGWDVVTGWRKRLATCPRADIVLGLLVMGVTLVLGTVPAIAFGVTSAMVLYVRNTSRSPVRGHVDGSVRLSAKVRDDARTRHLRGLESAIRIVEAQGSIFFGTADGFGLNVESLAEGCRHVILDFKRVHDIDPTGALVISQTLRRLGDQGVKVAIASVSTEGRRGDALRRAGVDKLVPPGRWFEDADRALEHAEDEELRDAALVPDPDIELPLDAMDVCRGMAEPESAALATYLERVEVQAGRPLFREGDEGNRLYLLAKGDVTVLIRIPGKDGRTRRLVTYGPGVTIGEMAVLEAQPRSADAMALTDCVLYALNGDALARMQREAPQLHSHFALNLARQLVVRLRALTGELRAAYG